MTDTGPRAFAESVDLLELVHRAYADVDKDWLTFAWTRLADSALVPRAVTYEHVQYPNQAVALTALGLFATRFLAALQGADDPDVTEVPDLLAGGPGATGDDVRPQITPFELGFYCGEEGVRPEECAPDPNAYLTAAVSARIPAIRAALLEHIGDAALFVSLVQVNRGQFASDEHEAPTSLDDEALDTVLNHDTPPDRHRAWEWLTVPPGI